MICTFVNLFFYFFQAIIEDKCTRLDTSCYYSDEEEDSQNEHDPLNPSACNEYDSLTPSIHNLAHDNEKSKLMLNLTHIDVIEFADE